MKVKTVKKLIKMNREFYMTVGREFDKTRQSGWKGWDKLVKYIKMLEGEFKVLDVGCGNGRFGEFLVNNKFNFEYSGIDNSEVLLKKAKVKLKDLSPTPFLINTQVTQHIPFDNDYFDLIVGFGILHHIPSKELRLKLVDTLKNKLSNNGLLIISFWQFAKDERFKKKLIRPEGLDLEENDYLLPFANNQLLRYCHSFDSEEIMELVSKSGMKKIVSFEADGKNGRLNRYIILSK